MNVRAPFTGIHKRDSAREPIRSTEDKNLAWLEKFIDVLQKWMEQELDIFKQPPPDPASKKKPPKLHNDKTGKLTRDTFIAIMHTTRTLIILSRYLLTKFKFDYILLGKFQTDRLEGRFGKYRMLSGCHYHVSVCQILESERKIKVLSYLKLKSSKFGNFEITNLELDDFPDMSDTADINAFEICLDASENIRLKKNQEQIFFHIGGYVSHSLLKYVADCKDCIRVVKGAVDLQFEVEHELTEEAKTYLRNLIRGGLKEPTAIIYDVTCIIFCIFQVLISAEFGEKFLNIPSQRSLLKNSCHCINYSLHWT